MKAPARSTLVTWYLILCVQVLLIVVVGGITRLTNSGLSMTEWKPIMGVLPPRDHVQWMAAFEQYKTYPEYRELHPDMTLDGFRAIYFWEYLHRMLARSLGLIFLFPYLFFLLRRRLSRSLAIKLLGGFLLGGLQGFAGWFMVKSGLADNPFVSHYRLAFHFSLALVIFSYFLWLALDLILPPPVAMAPAQRRKWLRMVAVLGALLAVQIVYGAFVAGLDAGLMHNTFPRMTGRWVPPEIMAMHPAWINPLKNPVTVQFIHRGLAWLLLGGAIGAWWTGRKSGLDQVRNGALRLFAVLVALQFGLGIATILLRVQIVVAILHQLMACLVVGSAVGMAYVFARR